MATTYKPIDYETLYGGISRARKNALDAALAGQRATLGQQAGLLGGQYNTLRGQAYSNSRLTALGNNEALAANGLAGSPNSAPTSGYSETSRTAQNVALQNSINGLNQQEQTARQDITNQGTAALLNRDQQWANTLADLDTQKTSAQAQQNQFTATYDQQERAAALARAQANLQAFGKVTNAADAAALGVPVGTKLWTVGGGGSGGGGGSSGTMSFDDFLKMFGNYDAVQNEATRVAAKTPTWYSNTQAQLKAEEDLKKRIAAGTPKSLPRISSGGTGGAMARTIK